MKGVISKPVSLVAPLLVPAVVIVLAQSADTLAQGGGRAGASRPGPTAGGRRPEGQQLPSIRERQMRMSQMEREAARPRTPEEERLALIQIAEDYERIQIVHNKMMAAVFSAAVPDYGNIAAATAEVGKRAGRLKANLHLPQPGEPAKKPPPSAPGDAAALKALLLALDKSLMSFVKSPVFSSVGVLDAEAAATARGDLETLIELSHFVSKCAEKMAKTAGQR